MSTLSSPTADGAAVPSGPDELRCPQCRSAGRVALGIGVAYAAEMSCRCAVRIGASDLLIGARCSAQGSRISEGFPMTNALSWHSALALGGAAIKAKDRVPGHGGGDPCAHCNGLLVQSIQARLLRKRDE